MVFEGVYGLIVDVNFNGVDIDVLMYISSTNLETMVRIFRQ
jgi:hypothetical protein